MILGSSLQKFLSVFAFDSVGNLFECLVIIITCYGVMSWLAREKTRVFLPILYGWMIALGLCYYCSLDVLFFLSLISSPLLILCFVLFHEDKLQKNFVMYKTASIPEQKIDWTAHLMRSLITATNKGKHIICFIERTDSLQSFFDTAHRIQAPIHFSTLDMIATTSKEPVTLLLSQSCATIIGSTLTVRKVSEADDILTITDIIPFLTAHNDCIIIHNNIHNRSYDIFNSDNHLINLSPEHALRMLQNYLALPEGTPHEFSSSFRQQSSHHA